MTRLASATLVLIVALVPACYRPSEEFLARTGNPADDAPAPDTQATPTPGSGSPALPAGPPTPPTTGAAEVAGAAAAPPPTSQVPSAETLESDVRTLFEKQGLKALPTLEAAISANPDDTGTLLRGAFAGVGNATEQAQEILLYLTIRHPELAEPLAHAAAQVNPEITSFLQ